jgi:hypothetical protein
VPCTLHPEVEAPWECVRCGAVLCDACVRYLESGVSVQRVAGCSRCGSVLRRAARTLAPPLEQMRELMRRPFSAEGLIMAGALAVPAGLAALATGPVVSVSQAAGMLAIRGIYLGSLAGYYFQTVDHVGRGDPGLPFSSNSVFDRMTLLYAVGRGAVCFGVGFGPMLIWRALVPIQSTPLDLLSSFVWLALGLALMPAAVIGTVLGGGALAGAWPLNWARIIGNAPSSYARFAGLFAGTAVAGVALFVAVQETIGRIPVLGGFASGMALSLAAIVQAVIIGGFLRRNAEDFGYD